MTGGWRLLKEHLTAKGYTVPEMLKAGVVKHGADGKDPFDVFRDRVMFPLRDAAGKVVGFSGRTLTPDEKTPKYVNSPETELYKKSDLLFGYDSAKNTIRTLDFSLIVEGQFDVVMSHQAGYSNTVAVSGTALTLHHVQLLERLSTRVVLALDADRAGIAAMQRAADLMLRRGFDVKVAKLPSGADPADLVRSDVAALKQAVGGAVPIIEFLLAHLKEGAGDERAYRLAVRESVIPYITLIPNRIDQEHFTGIVAAALGVSVDAVRFEVERAREVAAASVTTPASQVVTKEAAPATVPRIDQRVELVAFLLAAADVVGGGAGERLRAAVVTELGRTPEATERPTELYARYIIELEGLRERLPRLAFISELVAKLNHLRSLVIKEALFELRQRLVAATTASGGEDEADLLAAIATWEVRRKAPAYDDSLLTTP
jgi:DNA primase